MSIPSTYKIVENVVEATKEAIKDGGCWHLAAFFIQQKWFNTGFSRNYNMTVKRHVRHVEECGFKKETLASELGTFFYKLRASSQNTVGQTYRLTAESLFECGVCTPAELDYEFPKMTSYFRGHPYTWLFMSYAGASTILPFLTRGYDLSCHDGTKLPKISRFGCHGIVNALMNEYCYAMANHSTDASVKECEAALTLALKNAGKRGARKMLKEHCQGEWSAICGPFRYNVRSATKFLKEHGADPKDSPWIEDLMIGVSRGDFPNRQDKNAMILCSQEFPDSAASKVFVDSGFLG